MDSRQIREKFLFFFEEHGHQIVPSASLVPPNDPTLYFVNAGMVPFKDVFTGQQTRPYSRACSSQKCLRVSGKHNDLEAVGRTPKHHTLFEMLGNFSFGDYFKRDAIRLAWRFLTDVIGLDGERMVATVFGGDDGVPADEEAFAIWRDEVGLPEARIFRLGKADNFWSMGDSGPCGPCSEIHLLADGNVPLARALQAGGPAVDERWVEVWNLVFMQFDRQDGELAALKKTGVDTGMGLERLTALVNGKTTTYDTDLFRPLIEKVAELADRPYGRDEATDVSLRVVADHARATAFCIADGVFPEKGGREYVLRRIMRRAIRHGKQGLGLQEPFFDRVCLAVVDQLGDVYDDLHARKDVIEKIVAAEEASFRRTLDRGLEKLGGVIEGVKKEGGRVLPAASVGDLYATDGFPVDLTRVIAEENGLEVDEQAALSWVQKTHGGGDSRVGDAAIPAIYKTLDETHPPTEFVGYDRTRATGKVLALIRDNQAVERALAGETVEIVCDKTPFYARAGGQVGDRGTMENDSVKLLVSDTIKPVSAVIVHKARIETGSLAIGDDLSLTVDEPRRQRIRLNHSATHLLHHALRTVLGTHVAQKGSEVSETALRFDFSHFQAMTGDEIARVEQLVNAAIRQNSAAKTELMGLEQAKKTGAMALFGEKYGDDVRVVVIGDTRELCGGTHVERSGDIGCFRLISEESLALGVRRVVAYTGEAALLFDQTQREMLQSASAAIKSTPDQLAARLTKLLAQLKEQEREIAQLKKELATGGAGGDPLAQVREVNGLKVLVTRLDSGDPKVMREAGDTLRDRLGSGVIVLAGEHQGKATILVMVTKDLTRRAHAGNIVKELAELVGGRGGGRPDMAQAGGPNVDQIDSALERALELVSGM